MTCPPVGCAAAKLYCLEGIEQRLRYPWESPDRFGVSVTGGKSTTTAQCPRLSAGTTLQIPVRPYYPQFLLGPKYMPYTKAIEQLAS